MGCGVCKRGRVHRTWKGCGYGRAWGESKIKFSCGHLEVPPESRESLIHFILVPHSVTIPTLLKTEWTTEETHELENQEDSISGP